MGWLRPLPGAPVEAMASGVETKETCRGFKWIGARGGMEDSGASGQHASILPQSHRESRSNIQGNVYDGATRYSARPTSTGRWGASSRKQAGRGDRPRAAITATGASTELWRPALIIVRRPSSEPELGPMSASRGARDPAMPKIDRTIPSAVGLGARCPRLGQNCGPRVVSETGAGSPAALCIGGDASAHGIESELEHARRGFNGSGSARTPGLRCIAHKLVKRALAQGKSPMQRPAKRAVSSKTTALGGQSRTQRPHQRAPAGDS